MRIRSGRPRKEEGSLKSEHMSFRVTPEVKEGLRRLQDYFNAPPRHTVELALNLVASVIDADENELVGLERERAQVELRLRVARETVLRKTEHEVERKALEKKIAEENAAYAAERAALLASPEEHTASVKDRLLREVLEMDARDALPQETDE